jgi:hypothetical protein
LNRSLGEPARNVFGDPKVAALLEADVVVDVDDFAGLEVDQQVVQMP